MAIAQTKPCLKTRIQLCTEEVHNQVQGNENVDNAKQKNLDTPIAGLRDRDIKIGADGTFKITVDNKPVNGRVNHIQSTADAKTLLVRNTFKYSLAAWNGLDLMDKLLDAIDLARDACRQPRRVRSRPVR